MIRNSRALTISSYSAMFFLGVSGALIGSAARNIGLTASQIGLLIAAQNIGFMLAVSISGALADRLPKTRLLLVGSLVMAFSLFAFFGSGPLWINLLVMFLNGVGIGVYEGVTDAMLMDLHEHRVSLHINLNHFFVTLGSIVIAIYLTYLQEEWRIAIIQAGIVLLGLSIFFLLARLEARRGASGGYLGALHILARERVVIALFLATILVVGAEAGTIGLLTTYLMDLRQFTQVTSKIGLTVFLLGIASGRLLVGYLTHREQIRRTLLWLFALSVVFFALLYFASLGWLTYVLIFLAGGAISAIFPLMITLAGLLYKEIAGTVVGTIKIAIPLGGILIPALLALVAGAATFQQSMLIFPLVSLAGYLVLQFGLRDVHLEA